jgi:hypothetical protein
MAEITLASPGVQINEEDISIISRPSGSTDVLITGFADQGPTEDIVNITSLSEFEQVYGTPKNAAERYLYHSAKQLLLSSPANVLVSRVPYGSGSGEGYANTYSALVYQLSANAPTYEGATEFNLREPVSMLLSDAEYKTLTENNITWSSTYSNDQTITSFADIGKAGLVVLNSAKTTVNNLFEGYYVSLTDNSEINPSTDFNAVTSIKSVNAINGVQQTFTTIPSSRLKFTLNQSFSSFGGTSISKVIENYPKDYNFDGNAFNDSLVLMVFRIKTSQYNQDTVTLDYGVSEGFTGSLYERRTQNNPNGGPASSFFIDTVVNKQSNLIKTFTNPYVSTRGAWTTNTGQPAKKVRVTNAAKNLYSTGVYASDTDFKSKDVGNIPQKLQRILRKLENDDTINVDIVAEAGLGTIWAATKGRNEEMPTDQGIFDENYHIDLGGLSSKDNSLPTGQVYQAYTDIVNQFVVFADQTKKNHLFIADPLRNIFIQGENARISDKTDYVFSNDVYWPLKNLFGFIQSSYVTTYGNWVSTNDAFIDKNVWVPMSGYAAAIMASVSQESYPWIAPAGFSRGTLLGVSDLAVNPTQKQRDLLYKININPVAFFKNDGYVIFGQKTLYRQPSAFDRINVRRLFLVLEKQTQELLKYFVFEQNSFATRNRLKGALLPLFDQAKLNDGLYDYQLVCDERNNTPDVIDNNELRISIYIKPVRTAEYILADFIATRTGIEFSELIG